MPTVDTARRALPPGPGSVAARGQRSRPRRAGGAALLALLLVAAPAHGQFWGRGARELGPRERAAAEGDEELALARRAKSQSRELDALEHGTRALAAYEQALSSGADAELHYRAYVAAYNYLPEDVFKWKAVLRHIDGLRAADPLDPRAAVVAMPFCHTAAHVAALGGPGADDLFDRAIAEYEAWFRLVDDTAPGSQSTLATNHANMAELLMARGRLAEAISHYRRSADIGSTERPELAFYGLAVAYDRDGQWENARAAMRRALDFDPNMQTIARADMPTILGFEVYFVPQGDRDYYLALGYHVMGRASEARDMYRSYLGRVKGARKEYLARAREHLGELGRGR